MKSKKRTHIHLAAVFAAAITVSACAGSSSGGSSPASDAAPSSEAAPASEAAPVSEASPATDAAPATDAPKATDAGAATTVAAASGGDTTPIKLGIMAECEGAFGGFNEDVVAGVELALINFAGGKAKSRTSALDGVEGATIAGRPVEIVGIGCGDDTADRAIQEVRKLVEEKKAEIVVGPASGDESIALANYAKDHKEVTFINGIGGAQETTLAVRAENYFRYNGDGAQWNAGLGDTLYSKAGWKKVAVIADDYSFGWTSSAGFIADFCAAGGQVVKRVYPPLGTTDYSTFIAQLPDTNEVDGYFWAVGGTGTQASLEAFVNSKGELSGKQHAGNLFFNPGLASALGKNIAGAYVGGFASLPGDVKTPAITEYLASADKAWDTLPGALSANKPAKPSTAAGFGFFYGYYTGGMAMIQALNSVKGDLSDGHVAFRKALASQTLDAPFGKISLDKNRQAIVDTSVQQLVLNDKGEVVSKTIAIIPGVDQTFGGIFSDTTPAPSRENPGCKTATLPWQGKGIPVVDGVPAP